MTDARVLLRAAELFNRKLYFECHDVLEDAWAEARGEERLFLQGLIHVAVGMYHLTADNHRGAVNQFEKSVRRLEPFVPERDGLDVKGLVAASGRCLEKARQALQGAVVDWRNEDVPCMRVHG